MDTTQLGPRSQSCSVDSVVVSQTTNTSHTDDLFGRQMVNVDELLSTNWGVTERDAPCSVKQANKIKAERQKALKLEKLKEKKAKGKANEDANFNPIVDEIVITVGCPAASEADTPSPYSFPALLEHPHTPVEIFHSFSSSSSDDSSSESWGSTSSSPETWDGFLESVNLNAIPKPYWTPSSPLNPASNAGGGAGAPPAPSAGPTPPPKDVYGGTIFPNGNPLAVPIFPQGRAGAEVHVAKLTPCELRTAKWNLLTRDFRLIGQRIVENLCVVGAMITIDLFTGPVPDALKLADAATKTIDSSIIVAVDVALLATSAVLAVLPSTDLVQATSIRGSFGDLCVSTKKLLKRVTALSWLDRKSVV